MHYCVFGNKIIIVDKVLVACYIDDMFETGIHVALDLRRVGGELGIPARYSKDMVIKKFTVTVLAVFGDGGLVDYEEC